MQGCKLLLPAALLAAFMLCGFALRGHLGWTALAAHQGALRDWVARAPVAAAAAYCLGYAGAVALSLPLGGVLTVAGGLLFGPVAGAALAVVAATLGALTLFLVARGVFAPMLARALARRAGPFLERVRPGLHRDGFSYLLALRLIPVVPFWLGNLAPALLGMRLAPFVLATLLGILPTTAILAAIGAGLGGVLADGGRPDLSLLVAPPVLLPLAGLAAVSLAPLAWRRWRRQGG
jgi:uncharacterized membrane protein YdjX (TVP38/TMEM64 family)